MAQGILATFEVTPKGVAISGEKIARIALKGIFVITVCVYLYALGVTSLTFNGQYTPDSVVYVNTAEVMAGGNGMAMSAAPLEMAVVDNLTLPVPVSSYAPGYPFVLAVSSKLGGIKTNSLALLVPIICLGLLFGFAYQATRKAFGTDSGLVAVALLANFWPLIDAAKHAWSESMGIALALASITFLLHTIKVRSGGHSFLHIVFLSGILAGLAFLTRYALLPLVMLAVVVLAERNWNRSLRAIFSFGLGHLIVSGGWIIRNMSLPTGSTPPREMSMGRIVTDFLLVVKELVSPSFGLTSLLLATMAIATCGAGALILKKKEGFSSVPWLLALPFGVWVAVYLVFLAYAETTKHIDPVNLRLTLPATVVVVMVIGGIIGRLTLFPRIVVQVMAVIIMTIPCISEMQTVKTVGQIAMKKGIFSGPNTPEEIKYLAETVGERDLVIAEDGLFVPFFAGPVKTLYFSGFPKISAGELRSYLDKGKYDDVFIVLRPGTDEEREAKLKSFFAEAIGEKVRLRFASEGGNVFGRSA